MEDSAAGDEFNNLQTWPRSQLSHRAMNDLNQWIQVENTIHHAKQYVKGLDSEEEEGSTTTRKTSTVDGGPRELIENLCEMLERLRDVKSTLLSENFHGGRLPRTLRQTSEGPTRPSEAMGTIREEPHFESMIICEPSSQPTESNQNTMLARSTLSMFKETPAPLQGLSQGNDPAAIPPAGLVEQGAAVDPGEDFSTDPLLLRAIPHITVLSAVLWLVAGAWIFQVIHYVVDRFPVR